MTLIHIILDFLSITWVFWPIILTLPFVAYYNVTSAVKEDECEVFAGALIVAIVGILAYKYPAFRGYFDGWRAVAVVLGGYVVAGFLLSLYKWFVVLWDFRKMNVKETVEKCRKEFRESESKGDRYSPSIKDRVYEHRDFRKCVIETSDATFMIYPNWKHYPIGTWWVYWPFFLLELPFDFVKRIMENLFTWLKHFYNGIAQKFAVTA